MKDRQGHQLFNATISEIADSPAVKGKDIVKVDPSVLENVSSGDENPQFVTINVAVEGKSKNGRIYTRDTIQSICDQINSNMPDGNLGHVREEDRPWVRPNPETIWLGAKVEIKNGKAHLYAKGYVMPDAQKLRTYLEKCKMLGKNVAVSIYGKTKKAVYDAKQKAYKLEGFMLESIDWSRSGSAGIPNDGTLILASEMEGNNPNKEDQVDPEQIKKLTKDQLAQHNPQLVSEIQSDAGSGADEELVSEMDSVKELTGKDRKPSEVISEMQDENRRLQMRDELREKVESPAARQTLEGMVVSEMKSLAADGKDFVVSDVVDTVLGSEEGRVVIEQHVEKAPTVSPTDRREEHKPGKRQFTKIVDRKSKKD